MASVSLTEAEIVGVSKFLWRNIIKGKSSLNVLQGISLFSLYEIFGNILTRGFSLFAEFEILLLGPYEK